MIKNKKKKGFILAYSVIVMTFITLLIVTAISFLESNISIAKSVVSNFNDDVTMAQIEEYLIAGDYGGASGMAIGTNIRIEIVKQEDVGEYKITVYKGSNVELYIHRYRGEIVKLSYGEIPEED